MVRRVTGDEAQLTAFETRLSNSGITCEVGVVVGKLNTELDRGFVYALIPTPPPPPPPPTDNGGKPACFLPLPDYASKANNKTDKKKPSSSASSSPSLVIDVDWVAEHARQVSKMLLGGMHVVGIYVWVSESAFKSSHAILWQTTKAVATASSIHGSDVDGRLLIHIMYSPRRWSCRFCSLGSSFTSTNLRPCDFKMGNVLSTLQSCRCNYDFQMKLPILSDASLQHNNLKDTIYRGISYTAKILESTKALVNGKLVLGDQPLSADTVHEIELLLPFSSGPSIEACSGKEVTGLISLSGTVCASAYLSSKESVNQAVSDLKGDIIASLRSRLDIITDEAEQQLNSNSGGGEDSVDDSFENAVHPFLSHDLSNPCSLPFPRRILVPWLDDIFICDYLQPFETFEDVKERCKDLMSLEDILETSFLEPESIATATITKSFFDCVSENSAPKYEPECSSTKHKEVKSIPGEISSGSKSNHFSIAIIACLLLPIFLGILVKVFFSQQTKV